MSAPPTSSQSKEFAAAEKAAAGEWFIVLNPGSGAEEAHGKRELIETTLAGTGRRYRFIPVGAGGMLVACQLAAQWASAAGGVLVAAGGDGTINCAAQAALQHRCPLAVLPFGTFNLFARDHGMPEDPAEAILALQDAWPQQVQVGTVNQRVFLANAAVGLYPKLLEDRETIKEQMGKRRRWIALMACLVSLVRWRSQMRLEAELDGTLMRLRTPSLFVCNNRVQLERLGIDPEVVATVGEGRLAALVTHPVGLAAKLKLVLRAAMGRLGDALEIDSYSLRSLGVSTRSAQRLKVATDGEVQWMQLPLRFAVSPRPLTLMVPRPNPNEEEKE